MKRYIRASKVNRPIDDWKMLQVGQKLTMLCDEFDGHSETNCTVTEVCDDHAIAIEDCEVGRPQTLWIDDFNQDMFIYQNSSVNGTYQPIEIKFEGKKTCDTYDEALALKQSLGDRYRSMQKVIYPDCEFWIVNFEEDK